VRRLERRLRGRAVADDRFINVFLDTQFFDSNQMDFANKTFEVLRLNVAAGHIHVFSTSVTQREVERHVRERAAKAHEKLDAARKDPLLRHVKQPPFDVFHAGPTAGWCLTGIENPVSLWYPTS
jgi:hypothetical protein